APAAKLDDVAGAEGVATPIIEMNGTAIAEIEEQVTLQVVLAAQVEGARRASHGNRSHALVSRAPDREPFIKSDVGTGVEHERAICSDDCAVIKRAVGAKLAARRAAHTLEAQNATVDPGDAPVAVGHILSLRAVRRAGHRYRAAALDDQVANVRIAVA